MKDFKYKLVNVFFDADQIPCVFEKEIKEIYPNIDKFKINYNINGNYESRNFDSFVCNIEGEK